MTNSKKTVIIPSGPIETLDGTELLKLSEAGYPEAQVAYADHLARSWGSKEEQLKWLSQAYLQDNVVAAWKIGCLYAKEYHDNETALLWYERAAERGFTIAMMSIVYHYLSKITYDSYETMLAGYETAFAWLIKATQKGNVHSYRTFADFCFFGVQMEQDYAQAIRYYERAAEGGDDIACVMLWYCYKYGKGVPRDKEKVKYWFGKCKKINHRIPLRHHLIAWKKVAKRYKGAYSMDLRKYVL